MKFRFTRKGNDLAADAVPQMSLMSWFKTNIVQDKARKTRKHLRGEWNSFSMELNPTALTQTSNVTPQNSYSF